MSALSGLWLRHQPRCEVRVISLATLYQILAGSHGQDVDCFLAPTRLEVSGAICALISRGQSNRIRVEHASSTSEDSVRNGRLI